MIESAHDSYPSGADLEQFLIGAGVFDNPPTAEQNKLDLETEARAAAEQWETETGLMPYIEETADHTRIFDPPGSEPKAPTGGLIGGLRSLQLIPPLMALTSIFVFVRTAESDPGTELVLGEDFYLYPANAAQDGKPYTEVRFYAPQWGPRQSIHITGKWGASLKVENQVWRALLMLAAANIAASVKQGILSSPTQWKEGNSEETYAVTGVTELGQVWFERYQQTRGRLKTVEL